MNRYGKRCVLYPRVSTEMQVDGYSLEGQKNMLTRFADREEMIIVDTYEDAGKSGKSIEGRPAFQKMLRDIEDGLDIDYILVYKLSRFGRNAADILNSLELVQSYGVNLICIEEGIDSSQTSGKLLISVLSAVAEIERENIIEQTMNGRREILISVRNIHNLLLAVFAKSAFIVNSGHGMLPKNKFVNLTPMVLFCLVALKVLQKTIAHALRNTSLMRVCRY